MTAPEGDAAGLAVATAADRIAARLAEAGVRRAYGMPGGEVLTLVDALERAGIACVLARHETAAGFMAEADWHVTGAPAVLIATLGPGVMNGVNAVANASQDRVPLIVLTGCVDADEALTYTHQVLDHAAVLRPLVKESLRATARGADLVIDRAVTLAFQGRPGPVHVDLPISAAAAPSDPPRLRRRSLPAPSLPAPEALGRMRGWLAEARRPLIVAGLDAVNEGTGPALLALAERIGAPVVTTYKGKGLIPEDHPLSLGGAGLSPLADRMLLPLLARADCLLLAGYDPIEMRAGWTEAWDPDAQRVIEVSAAPADHYVHQATLAAVAHTRAALEALAEGLPPRETWSDGEPAAARAALAEAFPPGDPGDWGPGAVIAEARAALPDEVIATADSGAHRILLSQTWRTPAPRHLLQSSGLCTMGCALPLAIGACEAGRRAVAFCGDAGFLMVAGELSVAAERGLAPIVVVFVDASLALIEAKQRARQRPNAFVDFARHDVAAIGRAFGGHGVDVADREGLRAALADALAADRFTVIAAEIPPRAYDGRI